MFEENSLCLCTCSFFFFLKKYFQIIISLYTILYNFIKDLDIKCPFIRKMSQLKNILATISITRKESISEGNIPSQKFKYCGKRLLVRACGPRTPLYLLLLLKEIL